jgi:hypothetical protein
VLALGTSQALEGTATSATTVTYTVGGLLMSSASPPVATSYEVLAQGQLASSAASIYNPGSSATALISSIILFNTGGSAQTVSLYMEGTAGSNQIFAASIPAGGWAQYEDGNSWTVYSSSGLVVTGGLLYTDPPYTGTQSTTVSTTIPPSSVGTATEAALTSGTITLYPLEIATGLSVGHLVFISGTTAASNPTNWWFCLCNASLGLLAITADQTTTAWAASTLKSLAIATIASGSASTFITTYTGTYYIGIMVKATTVPTLQGWTPAATTLLTTAASGVIGGKSSTTSLTTPSGFPTTYGAITNSAFYVYGEAA